MSSRGRLEDLSRRMEAGAVLHARAADVLWRGPGLADDERACLELFVVEGLSDREIGRRLGQSRRWVESRLHPLLRACGYALTAKPLRPRWSQKDKQRALGLVCQGHSQRAASLALGVPLRTLHRWARKAGD
jgi:transposase